MPECFVLGGEVSLVGIDGYYFQSLRTYKIYELFVLDESITVCLRCNVIKRKASHFSRPCGS